LEAFAGQRTRGPAHRRRRRARGRVRAAAARDRRIEYLGRIERAALLAQLDARAPCPAVGVEDNGPLAILEAQARARRSW